MSTGATEQPKIILHWLEKSRAQRILWLLEECKAPYEVKTYKRVNRLAPPELKQIFPLGKSPLVTVEAAGQPQPLVLAESANICEYLVDHYAPHLVPTRYKPGQEGKVGGETESWLRYRFYMHYAEGSLMALLVARILFGALTGPEVPFFIKPITRAIVGKVEEAYLNPNMQTNFDFIESQLASSPDGGDYLTGNTLTAADILMSFPILAVRHGQEWDKAKYPKTTAYADRLDANEVYQRSIKKAEEATGEKYTLF